MCVKTGESREEDIMKKKFFAFATIALLSVMCLSVFAACTTDVDGKTFVFESYTVEFDEEAKETAEEKGIDLDKYIDLMEESVMEESGDHYTFYSTYEMTFKDGKFTQTLAGETSPALDYEQDGKIITIDGFTGKLDGMTEGESVTITVSGSKLVMEQNMRNEELEGIQTFKFTFKQK